MKKKTWCNYIKPKIYAIIFLNLIVIPLTIVLFYRFLQNTNINQIEPAILTLMIIVSLFILFIEIGLLCDLIYCSIVVVKHKYIGTITNVRRIGKFSSMFYIYYTNQIITASVKIPRLNSYKIRNKDKYLIGKEIHFYLNRKKNKAYVLYYYE